MSNPELLTKNFKCHGAVPNYRIVCASNTTPGAVRTNHVPGPLGIVQDRGGADGEDCDVLMIGLGKVELFESLGFGASVQAHIDNTGRAAANTDINYRVGRILAGGVAGDIVPILVCPN